jgi:excisionase family DNA binding protein
MTIQKDQRERQQGADPAGASEPRAELPTLPRGARSEGGRSPSASMNGRSTAHAAGRPVPADLSQYRAGRARGRAGDSEQAGNAIGLPLMLDAVRAVVRDEFDELRRQQTTQLATAAEEVLTMAGVVQLVRVSSKTVLKWIRKLDFPGSKPGAEWRFLRSEVLRWMGERNVR